MRTRLQDKRLGNRGLRNKALRVVRNQSFGGAPPPATAIALSSLSKGLYPGRSSLQLERERDWDARELAMIIVGALRTDETDESALLGLINSASKGLLPRIVHYIEANNGLMEASRKGHTKIVRLLLANGAIADPEIMLWAARYGHTKLVQLFLAYGANVNSATTKFQDHIPNNINNNYQTALMLASYNGHTDTVQLLLKSGANVNAIDSVHGDSALRMASERGHTNIVRLLVKSGANVNAVDFNSYTPLILAAMEGHIGVVQLLLDNGAKVNLHGDGFETPLIAASSFGHIDIVRLLLARGARVNARDKCVRQTALMAASHDGHTDIVRLLLAKGAKVNVTDKYGRTARMFAEQRGHMEVVSLLDNVFNKRRRSMRTR